MRLLSIAAFASLIASLAARPPNISNVHLETRILICASGQGRDSSGKCVTCPAGTLGQGESFPCQTCPAGSTSSSGSAYCTCKAGYYAPGGVAYGSEGGGSAAHSTSCFACPAGQSSTPGSSSCTPCPANTYSNSGGSCTPCPSGSASSIGASQCTSLSCPAGKYPSGNSCATCPAGSYSAAGAASCSDCPAGTISNAGSSACTICPAGSVPTSAGNVCTQCPANTYSSGDNCSACTAGQTSPAGSTSCSTVPQPSRRAQPLLASAPLCLGAGMQRCDVFTGRGGSECINILTTLDSCGGCVGPEGEVDTTSKYAGRDCSAIPHVDEVRCVQGSCEIKSCRAGYEPSGGSCSEKATYVGKNQTAHGSRVKRSVFGLHHDTF